MNASKSAIYHSGLHQNELDEIVASSGMSLGELPVRYLGVPLTTKALKGSDCSILIENIVARIRSWTVKHLSFAGRLQLIDSVLFSIQNFWTRILLLPAVVLREVMKLCNAFLWKGAEGTAKGAKVSWHVVCHPKEEGGLGIKDITCWNKACMLQHLWAVWRKSGSLWSNWIEYYVLKGESLLEVQANINHSWSWRKLPKLRDMLPTIGGFQDTYKARVTWDLLRDKKNVVSWYKAVWGKLHVPRHSFVTWLAVLDRLTTRARLHSWGVQVPLDCVLCTGGYEDRYHLFVSCPYSLALWNLILQACDYTASCDSWQDLLEFAQSKGHGTSVAATIFRLAWTTFIYMVWKERNSGIHGGSNRTVNVLFLRIKTIVRDRLVGGGFPLTSSALCLNWGLV